MYKEATTIVTHSFHHGQLTLDGIPPPASKQSDGQHKQETVAAPVPSTTLELRLRAIHDHLFANSAKKTPQSIAAEVIKVLKCAQYIERQREDSNPAFSFKKSDLNRLSRGEAGIARAIDAIREIYVLLGQELDEHASNADPIVLTDYDLMYVCVSLSGILLTDESHDVLGEATEVFRSIWAKKHGGQFFTDQRVTRLAMTMLQFNPRAGDDLVDICAGTGGFLLAALNHISEMQGSSGRNEPTVDDLATRCLVGREIDRDVSEVANMSIRLRLSTRPKSVVETGDSLISDAFKDPSSRIRFDSHDCAATNPPFGAKITVKDPKVLSSFELSRISNREQDVVRSAGIAARSLDTLFIEQNLKLLKPGTGRLAIVIPYQIASGPQTRYIREWILRHASLTAVVDLPNETFQPYTGTKTCLLLLKKRKRPLPTIDVRDDPPIFMSTPRHIGHDRRGNQTFVRLNDGSVASEILEDISAVCESFRAFVAGRDPADVFQQSFVLSPVAITPTDGYRMDAHFHRPLRHAGLAHRNSSRWTVVRLGDVVERVFYPGRFKRNYVRSGPGAVPFLGGTNISQLVVKTDKWVSCRHPHFRELQVRAGWVLVTRSGSTGIVATVPEAWDGYAMSEHVIRVVPDRDLLPPEYLYAFLRSAYAQELLQRGIHGSVIDEITTELIEGIKLIVPKDEAQMAEIVRIVRSGENARQLAVANLQVGVDRLNGMLAAYD